MSTKINGRTQPESIGNLAGHSITWGDIYAINRACTLWLKQHGNRTRRFNYFSQARPPAYRREQAE
jgi:hypothetical protein